MKRPLDRRWFVGAFAATVLVLQTGCIPAIYSSQIGPVSVSKPDDTYPMRLRVHLDDGSVVIFPRAVRVRTQLRGDGSGFDLARSPTGPVAAVDIARIVAIDGYGRKLNVPATIVASLPLTAIAVALLFAEFDLGSQLPVGHTGRWP